MQGESSTGWTHQECPPATEQGDRENEGKEKLWKVPKSGLVAHRESLAAELYEAASPAGPHTEVL